MTTYRVTLPVLLTPEELTDYLGISLRTIEGWRTTKKGPPFDRLGKHVRYPADKFEIGLSQRESP